MIVIKILTKEREIDKILSGRIERILSAVLEAEIDAGDVDLEVTGVNEPNPLVLDKDERDLLVLVLREQAKLVGQSVEHADKTDATGMVSYVIALQDLTIKVLQSSHV